MESAELARLTGGRNTNHAADSLGRQELQPARLASWPTAPSTNEPWLRFDESDWMLRPIIELGHVLSAMGLMRDNTGSFELTLAGEIERSNGRMTTRSDSSVASRFATARLSTAPRAS